VGYRIAVRIEEGEAAEGGVPTAEVPPPVAAAAGESLAAVRRVSRGWLGWGVAAVLGVLAMAVAAAWMDRRERRAEQIEVLLAEGFDLCRRGNLPDVAEGVQRFSLALKLDPDNALAMAGLAESGARSGKSGFEVSEELARRAVARAPECSECQAVLGWVLMARGWRWREAGAVLERAMAAPSPAPQAMVWKSMHLAVHGRLEEAAGLVSRLVQQHPHLAQGRVALAMTRFLSGRYREAGEECRRALAVQPRLAAAHYWMGRSAMQLGDEVGAIDGRAMEHAAWNGLDFAARNGLLARFHGDSRRGGRRGLVEGWIKEIGEGQAAETHRYNRAVWRAWIGDHDKALEELEAGLRSRPFNMIYTGVDPAFEPLRGNPRFEAVVRGVGLREDGGG